MILEELNIGDEFRIKDESTFSRYKVLKQGNGRTYCEKPSGLKDYYDSNTVVMRVMLTTTKQ